MFNIEFTAGKADTKVIADVTTDIPCERRRFLFEFVTGHQYSAQLLRSHCEDELRKAIRNLVRRAYQQGVVDGRNHCRVKTVFVDTLESLPEIGW